jgi:hypothetical protein
MHMDKKYIIQFAYTNIPTSLLFVLNLSSQSKARIYSNMGCCTYKLTSYVNSNTIILFRLGHITIFGYHEILDFQKKNDCLTNFCHIQIGPQGFIITNKQKRGLKNLKSNNKKSGLYKDHYERTININTYKIRFVKEQ